MTQPPVTPPIDLSEVATESPEESSSREIEVVGDEPDTGGTVPPDNAQ